MGIPFYVVGWWRIDKKRSARKRSALETAVSVDKIRRGWDAGIEKLSDLLERLIDARERRPPSQHFQRFKQWRGVLATADGYTNRLEHLSGFHSQFLSGSAEGLIQRVVLELRIGQH